MSIIDELRTNAHAVKGPLKIHGSSIEDHFTIDPENGIISASGAARATRRVPLLESGVIGSPSDSSFAVAGSASLIKSWDVSGTIDAGWYSRPITIEEWMSVDESIVLKSWVQWPAGTPLERYAVLQGAYTWARSNANQSGGVTNTSLSSITVKQPQLIGATHINHEVTLGTINAGTLIHGDILTASIQRLGTDGSDNSSAVIKLARYAWLEVIESRK